MPKTHQQSAERVTCPLCNDVLPVTASGCPECHLSMVDIRRHAASTPRARSWVRAAGVRVVGLSLYVAVVAWCWWQLPAAMPFVVPAAAVGVLLHGVKGRPWSGVLAFAVLVVVLPLLLTPALGTGAFSDLTAWIDDPQW